MNKIINHPDNMIKEMLEGYLSIYPGLFDKVDAPNTNGLMVHDHGDKVSIVVGGGAGNEPWIMGYVGRGLATGASLGNVYTAPPSRTILNVTKAVPHDRGVVYICTNHAGDVLNFELVSELAELEGITAKCVFVTDDITSEPIERKGERRGVAGIALVIKVAGAACDAGLSLDEVVRIATKAKQETYTFSVTTSPGYMPGSGRAMFEMPEGEIEYGMGFNGEPGVLHTKLTSADEIAETMMKYLCDDMKLTERDEIAVMINGFGFTSPLELCILGRRVRSLLAEKNARVHDIFIDELFRPQGTGGLSISIMRLDDELKKYYDMPAYSPFFKKEAIGG